MILEELESARRSIEIAERGPSETYMAPGIGMEFMAGPKLQRVFSILFP